MNLDDQTVRFILAAAVGWASRTLSHAGDNS